MSVLTRSSPCTGNGPTLGFHLELCVMGSNDGGRQVSGILLGSTFTVCALASVNGGSYVTGSGATTLTFIGPMDGGQYPSVGDSIIPVGLSGTGGFNSLNGQTYTLTSVTYSNSGGSTLVTVGFTAATGLGTTTITGGSLFDITAAQPHPMVSIGRAITNGAVGAIVPHIVRWSTGMERKYWRLKSQGPDSFRSRQSQLLETAERRKALVCRPSI